MVPFRTTVVLAVVLFTSSAMPSRTIRAQTGDFIDDPDAYAVYASVIPTRLGTGGKPLTGLALLQETRAGENCVGPERDKKLQPEWHSVTESFRRENALVRIIQAGFDLGVPYTIVTMAHLRKLMRDAGYSEQSPRSNALGWDVFARFPSGRLVALSAVGFNAGKTRAMVAMQYDCFPSWKPGTESAVCRQGRHFALEKKEGRWNVADNVPVGCVWIA
jgi:hypothetical protein